MGIEDNMTVLSLMLSAVAENEATWKGCDRGNAKVIPRV